MSQPLATTPSIDSLAPAWAWNKLTSDDKAEFYRLRLQFHQAQRQSGKDRRVVSFQKELLTVLAFVERRSEGKEERSIVCGAGFAGKFICVNTRSLKAFLGRCKSSINGSFQQMGYVALRTKTKARNCVLSIMHSLIDDVTNLRQWTVRCVSKNAQSPIGSSFPEAKIPEISDDDLVRLPDRPKIQQMKFLPMAIPSQIPPIVNIQPLLDVQVPELEFCVDMFPENELGALEPLTVPSLSNSMPDELMIGFDEYRL